MRWSRTHDGETSREHDSICCNGPQADLWSPRTSSGCTGISNLYGSGRHRPSSSRSARSHSSGKWQPSNCQRTLPHAHEYYYGPMTHCLLHSVTCSCLSSYGQIADRPKPEDPEICHNMLWQELISALDALADVDQCAMVISSLDMRSASRPSSDSPMELVTYNQRLDGPYVASRDLIELWHLGRSCTALQCTFQQWRSVTKADAAAAEANVASRGSSSRYATAVDSYESIDESAGEHPAPPLHHPPPKEAPIPPTLQPSNSIGLLTAGPTAVLGEAADVEMRRSLQQETASKSRM